MQIYVGSGGAVQHRLVKLLKGYRRLELEAGETKNVSIDIDKTDLKFHDPETTQWVLDKTYTIFAGNSSAGAMKRKTQVTF